MSKKSQSNNTADAVHILNKYVVQLMTLYRYLRKYSKGMAAPRMDYGTADFFYMLDDIAADKYGIDLCAALRACCVRQRGKRTNNYYMAPDDLPDYLQIQIPAGKNLNQMIHLIRHDINDINRHIYMALYIASVIQDASCDISGLYNNIVWTVLHWSKYSFLLPTDKMVSARCRKNGIQDLPQYIVGMISMHAVPYTDVSDALITVMDYLSSNKCSLLDYDDWIKTRDPNFIRLFRSK